MRPSRRELLLGATAGAAACASGQPRTRVVSSFCRACTVHCAIHASLEEGRLVRTEGNAHGRTEGFICATGLALPELVYAPHRLATPLIGGAPASWDEALAHTARSLRGIAERYGPESLAVLSGWGFVRRGTAGLLHRFADA